MLKYIVYLDPVGLPRVTTAEFADQINEDHIISTCSRLAHAQSIVLDWYEDQANAYFDMSLNDFTALMGLSDVNE